MTKIKSPIDGDPLMREKLHSEWTQAFRGPENELYADMLFDYLKREAIYMRGTRVLDVGCGDGRFSRRLAEMGLQVISIDFSPVAVERAQKRVRDSGLEKSITVLQEDLTKLNMTEKFDGVFCHGVLMHIPDQEAAISNIFNVLNEGGRVVFSELNMYAPELVARRTISRIMGKKSVKYVWNQSSVVSWFETDDGPLQTRSHNVPMFIKQLEAKGFSLVARHSGELSELYTRVPRGVIRRAILALNRLWFRYDGLAELAVGQIIICEKRSS